MMKKIFSKRSGFTLVEIVVAFAVFAIMSAMILQILNLVMYEKQNNAAYAKELQTQEFLINKYGRGDAYEEVEGEDNPEMTFSFADGNTYKVNYQQKFAHGKDEEGNDLTYDDGLAYYVGPGASGSSDSALPGESLNGGDASAGAQMDRMDTRITGTAGFDSINIYNVVKDETFPKSDGYRYFFEVSASGANMVNEMVPYAQYKLYFYMADQYDAVKSSATYTDSLGNSFQRMVPKAAKIIDGGYVNDTDLEWDKDTCVPFDSYQNTGSYNSYAVKIMNDNCIRIGSPYVTGNSEGAVINSSSRGIRFKTSNHTRFYVVFKEDPKLTTESFGENIKDQGNVTVDGTTIRYSPVPIVNDDGTVSDKSYVNIYGAFEYQTKTKS